MEGDPFEMRYQIWNLDNDSLLEETSNRQEAYYLLAWYDSTEPGVNHGISERVDGQLDPL